MNKVILKYRVIEEIEIMTHDYIVKALAFDGEIRAYAALYN